MLQLCYAGKEILLNDSLSQDLVKVDNNSPIVGPGPSAVLVGYHLKSTALNAKITSSILFEKRHKPEISSQV